MKSNRLIPFAITAVVGILLIISLSFYALHDTKEEAGGGEQTELPVEEVYQANCASCHGGDLSGGFGKPLTTIGSKLSADEIKTIITDGVGQMPAQKQVGPEAAQKLADWLAEKK